MSDYQRQSRKNVYRLPKAAWMGALYLIRNYDTMKKLYDERLEEGYSIATDAPSGKTNRITDPTGMKAQKLSDLADDIRAIEKAKLVIPAEYMDGVWDSIVYRKRFPDDAHPNTYGNWRARFVYEVARNAKGIHF